MLSFWLSIWRTFLNLRYFIFEINFTKNWFFYWRNISILNYPKNNGLGSAGAPCMWCKHCLVLVSIFDFVLGFSSYTLTKCLSIVESC